MSGPQIRASALDLARRPLDPYALAIPDARNRPFQSPRFPIVLASLVEVLAMSSAAAQSSGVVQWCAGNGFPPGPFAAPDIACLALNRTDEYGNVWTDAAIDPESWSGRATGGYPGSFAFCMVTQSEIGPRQADLGTVHNVLPAVYAAHPPGACPNASPKDAGRSGMHVPLCVSIIGVFFLALFGSLWVRDKCLSCSSQKSASKKSILHWTNWRL
jgi:hypothetical protein